MDLVLDTWVLVKVNGESPPAKLLLSEILSSQDVHVIVNSKILQEYQAQGCRPGPSGRFLFQWWPQMETRRKLISSKAKLVKGDDSDLRAWAKAHRDAKIGEVDGAMVAAATSTQDKLIVSEEPGFKQVTNFLSSRFEVRVLSLRQALVLVRRKS